MRTRVLTCLGLEGPSVRAPHKLQGPDGLQVRKVRRFVWALEGFQVRLGLACLGSEGLHLRGHKGLQGLKFRPPEVCALFWPPRFPSQGPHIKDSQNPWPLCFPVLFPAGRPQLEAQDEAVD